jgi:hypothetical protein
MENPMEYAPINTTTTEQEEIDHRKISRRVSRWLRLNHELESVKRPSYVTILLHHDLLVVVQNCLQRLCTVLDEFHLISLVPFTVA